MPRIRPPSPSSRRRVRQGERQGAQAGRPQQEARTHRARPFERKREAEEAGSSQRSGGELSCPRPRPPRTRRRRQAEARGEAETPGPEKTPEQLAYMDDVAQWMGSKKGGVQSQRLYFARPWLLRNRSEAAERSSATRHCTGRVRTATWRRCAGCSASMTWTSRGVTTAAARCLLRHGRAEVVSVF